ncbi:hypothetical protein [Rubrivirga sp. IMCC43871]|uniref:hypothetical protein n=1 Tax=Rubrivirga sp. IMCC43871 TaxID=3391575 RepID=UPI00398FD034
MRFSLPLLFVLLAVAGCDTTEPDAPSPLAPAIPLAVGAEWTFEEAARIEYTDGVPSDTLAPASDTQYTLRATRDTVVAGETWVRIEAPRGFSHCVFEPSAWYANRQDGLYRWRSSPADAELVYAVTAAEGAPFLVTDVVSATLVDENAQVGVAGTTIPARVYARTWRRVEFSAEVRGPIVPTAETRDALSPSAGPVVLELIYVNHAGDDATFVPHLKRVYTRADL